MKENDILSFPLDFMPAKMIALSAILERRFDDVVYSCPVDENGVYNILHAETLHRLLDLRIASILTSLGALSAYMSYYGFRFSEELVSSGEADITVRKRLDHPLSLKEIERSTRKFVERHELILHRYGEMKVVDFLRAPLEDRDKIFYFPLLKLRLMPNMSDPTVSTLTKLMLTRDEILTPDFKYMVESCSEKLGDSTTELGWDMPESNDCFGDDRKIYEYYNQHNLLWEILHCAPPQTVQDFIIYLHKLDDSTPHFCAFIHAKRARDELDNVIEELRPRYIIKIG